MAFIHTKKGMSVISTGVPNFIGTFLVPEEIVGASGLDIDSTTNNSFQINAYVKGAGGPVNVTANPQISPGYAEGQRLTIFGTSDIDTVQFNNGNGLALNGNRILGENDQLTLYWDSMMWRELNANS